MAQQDLLDVDEFLGLSVPNAGVPSPSMSDVPTEKMDVDAFLGIAPGVRMALTQSARSASPSSYGHVNQFFSGAALGFGPEIEAAQQHLFADDELTYSNRVFNERQKKLSYERANPKLGPAIEIAGSIAPTVAANALTPGLSPLMRSRQLPVRMFGNALAGAETGFLQSKVTGGEPITNALTGGGIGAASSLVGAGVRRAITPKVAPGVVDSVRDMEALGIKLRPSQVAMNESLRKADEYMASGGNEKQIADFNRALSRTFGENTDTINSQLAGKAWNRITSEMDGIANLTQVKLVKGDLLDTGMASVSSRLTGLPKEAQNQVREVIRELRSELKSGSFSGEIYQRLTSKGGILMNLAAGSNHPTVRQLGGELRELLDDAVERHSAPGVKEQWAEARSQLKHLIAVQPLVEGNVTGRISPQLLHNQVKKTFQEYGWGNSIGPIQTLAEGGRLLPKVLPTGEAGAGAKLPSYLSPSVMMSGLGLSGLTEFYVFNQSPRLTATLAAGAVATGLGKHMFGQTLKSDFARNALTGKITEPGAIISGSKSFLTGAVNKLNTQAEDQQQ